MTTTRANTSLTARQKARQALQQEKAELEAREKALATVFATLDRRDAIDRELGVNLARIKKSGLSIADLAKQVGMSSKEVSALIALADNDDAADAEPDTDDSAADSTADSRDDSDEDRRLDSLSASGV